MKKIFFILLLLAIVTAGVIYFRNLYSGKTTVTVGTAKISAEVVDEPAELAQGLSGRDSLLSGNGMLFVFPNVDYHAIWMKDMKFPIDIIWLDENKQVVDVVESATPESYTDSQFSFKPIKPAK